MLWYSDNNVSNSLFNYFTFDTLNSIYSDAGFSSFYFSNYVGYPGDNYGSAYEIAVLLCYMWEDTSMVISHDYLLENMVVMDGYARVGLGDYIPGDVVFLNHNGVKDGVYAEAAIVDTGTEEFIIVFVANGGSYQDMTTAAAQHRRLCLRMSELKACLAHPDARFDAVDRRPAPLFSSSAFGGGLRHRHSLGIGCRGARRRAAERAGNFTHRPAPVMPTAPAESAALTPRRLPAQAFPTPTEVRGCADAPAEDARRDPSGGERIPSDSGRPDAGDRRPRRKSRRRNLERLCPASAGRGRPGMGPMGRRRRILRIAPGLRQPDQALRHGGRIRAGVAGEAR
jgi:hypothetical protein